MDQKIITEVKSENKIDELQKWFKDEQHLPQEIDLLLLRRFYQCMSGNMDEIKKVIKINYAIRNKNAHIFLKRDPLDEVTKRTNAYADMIPLPGLTAERYKVSFFRLCDNDPSKMHHTEDTKVFFMITDCRFAMPDVDGDSETLSEGEVQIFDMAGYSMKHVPKLTISTLRVYVQFLQQAFPVRLKAIHMINCPTYLDKIVAVVKPFISAEVYKMIHFHIHGIESLFEHVPRAMLPNEYGGKAGKIKDLKANMLKMLEEKREYLMDPHQWKIEQAEGGSSKWSFF